MIERKINYLYISTRNPIDLAGKSTLNVNVGASNVYFTEYTNFVIFVGSTKFSVDNYNWIVPTLGETHTISLDVSNITGSRYVGFRVVASAGRVISIWLE